MFQKSSLQGGLLVVVNRVINPINKWPLFKLVSLGGYDSPHRSGVIWATEKTGVFSAHRLHIVLHPGEYLVR